MPRSSERVPGTGSAFAGASGVTATFENSTFAPLFTPMPTAARGQRVGIHEREQLLAVGSIR